MIDYRVVFMQFLRRLSRDSGGNLLAMVAVSVLVLAALIGGGVDMSRAYMVQNRLQAACDAATLAGRRAETTNGFDTASQTVATNYFNANFNQTEQTAKNTTFTTSTPDDGNTVNGTATSQVDTLVMRIFGSQTFNLTVNCQSSMTLGNSDVIMVLDTTGSMADPLTSGGSSKITLLKAAMKSFYDTLDQATQGSNARVRYGFVPYSSTVNVGRLLYNLNPSYIRNSVTVQSRQANYNWWGGFSSWTYKPITYDTTQYKQFVSVSQPVGSNGSNVSSTWKGCIEERQSTNASSFSYSSSSGRITPTTATDLDIDAVPSSDATRWAPMWPQVAFYRTDNYGYYTTANSSYGGAMTEYCPAAAQALAEMDQTSFYNYADSLVANGGTYHDIGMLWGARLLSTTGIFQNLVNDPPANGAEVSRHIIFMTDGMMAPNYDIYQAYGIEYWDRRVTSDGYTDDAARHTSRFRAICDAAKAKGIRVWVIAYSVGLTTDLNYCASPDSAFTANSSASLNAAFQSIAKQIGELRVTQ